MLGCLDKTVKIGPCLLAAFDANEQQGGIYPPVGVMPISIKPTSGCQKSMKGSISVHKQSVYGQ